MDPVSTLGLVANVFEVISFVSELVSAGNQIYQSKNGLLDKNTTAEEVAKDLRDICIGLTESQAKWTVARGNAQLDSDEIRLRNICDRCSETAEELQIQLQKLKVQSGAKYRRLRSYRQAIIAVWREDEVDKIAARLEKYHRELDTQILVGLRKSAREADIRSNTQFTVLDRRTQDTILAVLEGREEIGTKLDDQTKLLLDIQHNTNRLIARTPSPPSYVETVASRGRQPTLLHTAAAAGDLLSLKKALRQSEGDINAKDERGATPLHLAKTGDVAKRLLAINGVRLNAEDDEGRSALHYAVLTQRLWVIKVLLEAGIDQDLQDDYGRTAYFYARECNAAWWMLKYGPETEAIAKDHLDNTGLFHMAWIGDVQGTKFFIEQGANVNATNAHKETALTEASRHGDAEVVKLLLHYGANIELACGDERWTPLLQAVRDNRADVVRILLDHGANKHAQKAGMFDAVSEACYRELHEIARMLIERGSKLESLNGQYRTPLVESARRNDGEWTRWLLKRGAKTDVRDKEGRNAVWHAANGGHHKSLAALLEYNCPFEVPSNNHWLPLGCAAQLGHTECVRLLLNAGAAMDIHQAHGSGYTPLCESAHHGRVGCVKVFLEHGANMELGSKSGFSALSVAAVNGQDAVVRILAEAGANLNRTGFANIDPDLNKTPLTRAVIAGQTSTALLLIELGANVNLRDADNTTALMFAAVRENASVVAALIARGADLDVQNASKGENALILATGRGNVEIVRRLVEAGANTRLKAERFVTAWDLAKQHNHDRELGALLGPQCVDEDGEELRRLREEGDVAKIASFMNRDHI